MRRKIKKTLYALLVLAVILHAGLLWWSKRPVDIVAVHKSGSHSYVLVKNFPFLDKEKINWWAKNKGVLKEKYDIPNPEKEGFYSVIFWDFGEGYKETDGYDRLCFDDMKTNINCIDKEKYFTVWNGRNNDISFGVHDGEYFIKENGQMVKRKYE